jgi:hypothetical protein
MMRELGGRRYTWQPHMLGYGRMSALLLGTNLVRLLYLDEAGIDRRASALCVAGVLVHGDAQWPQVDRRILDLIEKYIPGKDQLGFVFHATDIFHGSRYFDRRKPEWSDENRRAAILDELADIIDDLHIPVVLGLYDKENFSKLVLEETGSTMGSDSIAQLVAILNCLSKADHWLATNADMELTTVVHEDGVRIKPLIKRLVRAARDRQLLLAMGLSDEWIEASGYLPLRRIIDTVHFAEKSDARPLQLADLCAFIVSRVKRNKSVPPKTREIVFRHLKWIVDIESTSYYAREFPGVSET